MGRVATDVAMMPSSARGRGRPVAEGCLKSYMQDFKSLAVVPAYRTATVSRKAWGIWFFSRSMGYQPMSLSLN